MSEEKKLILIVDDDIDYLFQLKIIVESFGYKTITAETQKQAEETIKTIKPDLAIIDLMMESQDSGFILSYKISYEVKFHIRRQSWQKKKQLKSKELS